MKLSKKRRESLARRVRDWDAIRADGNLHGGKVKYDHGYAYRKPGSEKK